MVLMSLDHFGNDFNSMAIHNSISIPNTPISDGNATAPIASQTFQNSREGNRHAQASPCSDLQLFRHDVGDALRELHRISLGFFELLFLAVELTIWSHREKLPQPLRPRATHVTHRIKRGNQWHRRVWCLRWRLWQRRRWRWRRKRGEHRTCQESLYLLQMAVAHAAAADRAHPMLLRNPRSEA